LVSSFVLAASFIHYPPTPISKPHPSFKRFTLSGVCVPSAVPASSSNSHAFAKCFSPLNSKADVFFFYFLPEFLARPFLPAPDRVPPHEGRNMQLATLLAFGESPISSWFLSSSAALASLLRLSLAMP